MGTYARLDNLRNVRYGEFLFVHQGPEGFYADVWNTMGFNDCPPEQFNAVDVDAETKRLGALAGFRNGPRFWTFDALGAGMRETAPVETFGTLQMFLAATVGFGDTPPASMKYVDRFVQRDNYWEFAAHQPRFYLVTPDGTRYIMQAYAHYVDATQSFDTLPTLGEKLEMPEGWTFEVDLSPAEALRLGTGSENVAVVLQDELGNTYQRVVHVEDIS
jgi:hypothetical protein